METAIQPNPQNIHAIVIFSDKRNISSDLFTTGAQITVDELEKIFGDKSINVAGMAKTIEVLQEIPIVATGKTDYNKLIEFAKNKIK